LGNAEFSSLVADKAKQKSTTAGVLKAKCIVLCMKTNHNLTIWLLKDE